MALSGATTAGQSGHGSDDNEEVLCIPKSPASLKPHHQIVQSHIQNTRVVGESYSCAEVQSVYSTASADWAIHRVKCKNTFISDNSVKHT